jgi:PAS domain S-box-containing protein
VPEPIPLTGGARIIAPATRSPHLRRRDFLSAFPRSAAAIAGLISVLVLIGWSFDLDFLKRIQPNWVAMNPTTAAGFFIAALALILLSGGSRRKAPVVSPGLRVAAITLTLIGTVKLADLLLNFDSGIDRFFLCAKLDAHLAANPMAPNTALNFVFVGVALFLLGLRSRRVRAGALVFALIAGFEALVAILGYVYRIGSLYGIGSYIPMAPHTAVGFLLISSGIVVCQIRRGFLIALFADNASGRMARRLFPAAFLVPVVTGWLSLLGQRIGFYDAEFGVALYSVTNMVALSGIIFCSALSLFRVEGQRSLAQRKLRRAHDRLETRVRERTEELWSANEALKVAQQGLENRVQERTAKLVEAQSMLQGIVDHANSIIHVKDIDGKFVLVNQQVASFIGATEAEILGRTEHEFYPAEVADQFRENDLTALRAGAATEFEENLPKAGEIRTVISSKFPLRDIDGKTYALGCVSTDITALKRSEEELRASKRQLESAIEANQLIMDHSKDVIATVDFTGRFVLVNAASKRLWGYAPEELTGRHYTRVVFPEDIPKTDAVVTRIMAGESVPDFESRCLRQDGSLVHVLWSLSWSQADEKMFVVAHDVSEQAEANEKLRRAEAEANRANRAKSEFLSRMSHELRTPMNAILGFAQLLEMDEISDHQREGLDHILRGGRHLLDLINEVLDISRIEAGRLSLSVEPVEIAETLRETFDLVQPLARQREVRLNGPIGCETAYVHGDRQRLKQVLINLITNAIKYNRVGGTVTVSCEPIEERLRISVLDTGTGIPKEKRSQLFIPFERLGAEQGTIEGTGLGLALAKRLVEAMNGTMGMDSTVGEGSVFWIELPITQSPVQLAELPDILPQSAEYPQSSHTVLYIEDNLSNLRLVERLFDHRPSLTLLAANSGAAGLQLAAQRHPDLILLDLNLPDMEGSDVLRQLQARPETANTPVIVLSADATPGQKTKLMEAGAFAYLTKPLDVKKFFELLDRAIIERPFDKMSSGK